MADPSTCPDLTPASVKAAHAKISSHIHHTPLLTNRTIDTLASKPLYEGEKAPQLRLFFKCENTQRIGAFKARGAFHAVLRLIGEMGMEEVRRRGVVTHSSGNHAQALALAASTFQIPAHIVMPTISTPSKIAGTQAYTPHVRFSGSTSQEREAMVAQVVAETGAILVPPYDHPDIILGQGTAAMEMESQHKELVGGDRGLQAVLTPLGGGGLLSGTATWLNDKPSTLVFGAEPSYQGGNDGEIGLKSTPPKRIETVKTLTIADGLRTPVGKIPWSVLTGGNSTKAKFVESVFSATEDQIKDALRLVMERMKVFVEPSAVVPLAVILYNEEFRRMVADKQKDGEVWDVGLIFSGGNTTLDALAAMFGKGEEVGKRAEGLVGLDGKAVAENVAG